MTFKEFQAGMIAYAKSIRDSYKYAGNAYYRQDCWLGAFEDGLTPKEAVDNDMLNWEPCDPGDDRS